MADILDETFRFIQAIILPGGLPQPSVSSCDAWTDAEIIERRKTAPPLPDAVFSGFFGNGSNVHILCDDTVIKAVTPLRTWKGFAPEYLTLQFIRSHTTIPVPLVRRCVKGERWYIVMEKIEGTRLDKIWPSLSASQRFFVALTLRDYIRQLRQASMHHPRHHIPGPLGLGDAPQFCTGVTWLWSEKRVGPYASSAEFVAYLNKAFKLPKDSKDKGTYMFQARGTFDDSHPLVLTHMDLSLRNVVVGRDGRIWLVDFEWAGFYPPWFEHLATLSAADNDSYNQNSWMDKPGAQSAARSWWRYIPFVTGSWLREVNLHNYGYPSLHLKEPDASYEKENLHIALSVRAHS